jgi:integrase
MGVKVREWKGAGWLFVDHQGKRKARRVGVGRDGKKAADLAAIKIQARLAEGDTAVFGGGQNVPLFRDAAAHWLAAHVSLEQIRDSTHAEYARALRLYAFPRFGEKPVTAITRADVRDLLVGMMADGKSRSLARNLLAPVRQTFNQLIDDGIVTSNPASRMGQYLKTRVDPRTEIAFLTPDEEDTLLAAALRHAPRAYPLLLCALRTGLRFGELLGLQWDDVDERGRFIEVRRTLRDGQEDRRVALPKNGRIRRVDLSGQLAEELRRLRVERSRETLANGWGALPWVFVSSEGRPLFKANFAQRVFHPLLKKAALRRIRFHDLRHTFASRLLQNGESPAYVKEQMGHASIKITVDTYGHLIPGSNKAAVDRLDTTGRNPRATVTESRVSDVAVSGGVSWLPGLGSNQRLPD